MSNPAGTLDTSFISTDYMNNPGTMNGVYNLPPPGRVAVAAPELIRGGAVDLKNLEHVPGHPNMVVTPRVLKEGADSVGLHGALSRVYLNIGEYWEEWTRNFKPLVGIQKQTPIRVKDAQKLSPAWNWSEEASPDLAAYFIKFAKGHKLAEAPGEASTSPKIRLSSTAASSSSLRTAPAATRANGRRRASIRSHRREPHGSRRRW